jgi:hypothetical protein
MSDLIPSNEESILNEVKIRERSTKQKENDLKLAQRLREYHSRRREEKIKVLNNELNEYCKELQKEILEELPSEVEIVKAKRGRPKKLFPSAETQSI